MSASRVHACDSIFQSLTFIKQRSHFSPSLWLFSSSCRCGLTGRSVRSSQLSPLLQLGVVRPPLNSLCAARGHLLSEEFRAEVSVRRNAASRQHVPVRKMAPVHVPVVQKKVPGAIRRPNQFHLMIISKGKKRWGSLTNTFSSRTAFRE